MTIRAVLFDVGGPLDLEIIHERQCDQAMLAALHDAGVGATESDLQAAGERAVAAFAPFTYQAMLWDLCGGDEARARRAIAVFQAGSAERRAQRGGLEMRPSMPEMLRSLHARGLALGLAANQPASVIADLDRFGIGQLFSHREVSEHHGYLKPDVRLFLRACEDIGAPPEATVMVGDRIDNDIFPARLLGMRTVLFRTGRHVAQRPRSFHDLPDVEVTDVEELSAALERLVAEG